MEEIRDIAEYVANHPEDFQQRWRLAKQLYGGQEYGKALEHLLLLKRDWAATLNVRRYLAASYYRTGKHDEALVELEEAVRLWPNEIGLQEQMTRVLENIGNYARSRQVWEEIQKRQPEHPLAKKAIAKLKKREAGGGKKNTSVLDGSGPLPKLALAGAESSGGVLSSHDKSFGEPVDSSMPGEAQPPKKYAHLPVLNVCPQCGASNAMDVTRCWQCGERMAGKERSDPFSSVGRTEDRDPVVAFSSDSLNMMIIAGIAALFILGAYLSLDMLGAGRRPGDIIVIKSVQDVWSHQVGASRIIMGLVVVLLWPFTLHLGLKAIRVKRTISFMRINLSGVALGATAYVCSFLPFPLTALMVILPMALSLMLAVSVFNLKPAQATVLWLVQFGVILVAACASFVISESFLLGVLMNPFREAAAAAAYAAIPVKANGRYLPQSQLPINQRIVWKSTGSDWLDRRGGDIVITMVTASPDKDLKFQLLEGSDPTLFDYVTEKHFVRTVSAKSDKEYVLKITGKAGSEAQVFLQGLRLPEFIE